MASGSLRVRELFSSRLGGIEPRAIVRICVAVGISPEEAEVLLEEAARDLDWANRGIIDGEEFLEWLYSTTCKNSLVTTPRDEWPTGKELEETMSMLQNVQVPDGLPADIEQGDLPMQPGELAEGPQAIDPNAIPAAWPLDLSASALEISPTAVRGVEAMAATATAGLEWHCPGETTPVLTEGYSRVLEEGGWVEEPAPLGVPLLPVPIAEEPSGTAAGEMSAVMEDDESAAARAMPSPASIERMLGASMLDDHRALSANAEVSCLPNSSAVMVAPEPMGEPPIGEQPPEEEVFLGQEEHAEEQVCEPQEEPEAPSVLIRSETAQATIFQAPIFEPHEEQEPDAPPAPIMSETAQATVFQAQLQEAVVPEVHTAAAVEVAGEAEVPDVAAAPEEAPAPDYEEDFEPTPEEPLCLEEAVAEEAAPLPEEQYLVQEEQQAVEGEDAAPPFQDTVVQPAEAPAVDSVEEVAGQPEPVANAEIETQAQQTEGAAPDSQDHWGNAPRDELGDAERRPVSIAGFGPGALEPGTLIRVRGLVHKPELNGTEGRLIRWNEHKGCWYVNIEGKQSGLKPENITLATQALNTDGPAPTRFAAETHATEQTEQIAQPHPLHVPVVGLHPGNLVRICGFKKETSLNGEIGILRSWNPDDRCWLVDIRRDQTQVALNVENLIPLNGEKLSPSDDADAQPGAPVHESLGDTPHNGGFMPGASVRLVNLRSKAHCHLNGMMGVIESRDTSRNCWNVHVVDLNEVKALRSENLVALDEMSPPPADAVHTAFDRQFELHADAVVKETLPVPAEVAPTAGRRLIIQSWKDKPELHGVAASFAFSDGATGSWAVDLGNGERILVPPSFCHLLDPMATLAPGMRVVVRGLEKSPEFNEKVGFLESWYSRKAMWCVNFNNDKKLLKPKNLFAYVPPVSEQVPTPTTAASADEPLTTMAMNGANQDGLHVAHEEGPVPAAQQDQVATIQQAQDLPILKKGMVAKLRNISSMPSLNGVCVRLQDFYDDGLWRICFEDGREFRVTADKLHDAEFLAGYEQHVAQQQLHERQHQQLHC